MTRTRLLQLTALAVVALVVAVIAIVPFDFDNSRVQQGAIAALVVALGWFAGFFLRELGEQIGRNERLRDLHRAIYAEIETNLSNLWDAATIRAHGDALVERMKGDADFVPFVPKETHDRLFDTIAGDIHILPRVTIDPIVKYYAQLGSIAALAADMRGDAFRSLSQDRRIAVFTDYTEMRVQALSYGRIANALIKTFADRGKAAAEDQAARISSRRADLSDP